MWIEYCCPQCHATCRQDSIESTDILTCQKCKLIMRIAPQSIGNDRLTRCLVCPSAELFVRKNFPQKLGVWIVTAGLAGSCVAWAWHELIATFAILFATALVDVVLYMVVPNCLACYRCQARYGGVESHGTFTGFNLETHERHRQFLARSESLAGSKKL